MVSTLFERRRSGRSGLFTSGQLAVAATCLCAGALHAATTTWSGGAGAGSEGWGQANNWGGSLPTFNNTLDATFNTAGAGNLSNFLGAHRTIRSLTFNENADSAISIRTASALSGGSGFVLTLDTDVAGGNAEIVVESGAAGAITLGAGTGSINLADPLVVTHNGGGTLTINRPVNGGFGLTKAGTNTLVLSGANGYTGETTIQRGMLQISANNHLGAVATGATLSISNGATLYTTGTFNLDNSGANKRNVVIAGTVTSSVNSGTTLGITGVISGTGNLVKAGAGTLVLGGLNTFEGKTILAEFTGSTLSVNSLAEVGTECALGKGVSGTNTNAPIQVQAPGGANTTITYTGGEASSDRVIYVIDQIGSTFTLNASGTGALTLGSPSAGSYILGIGNNNNGTDGNTLLVLGGTSDASLENRITGGLTDNKSTLGTVRDRGVNLAKRDANTWSLEGNKDFRGYVAVEGGVLQFDSVANVGAASSLGLGNKLHTTPAFNFSLSNGGTLRYIGAGDSSTDRTLSLNSDGTLDAGAAAGVGALAFSGRISSRAASGANTLTLAGANPGLNRIAGVIGNGTNDVTKIALTKTGAGQWLLSGTNFYSGPTSVTNGTLLVNGDQSAATGLATVYTNAAFGGTGTVWQAVVKAGGRLTPGSEGAGTFSVSNLTVEAGARLVWDIASGATDRVAAGALMLPASGRLYLDATLSGGAALGGTVLFTYQTYSGPQAVPVEVAGSGESYKAVNDAANKRIVFRPWGTLIMVQ